MIQTETDKHRDNGAHDEDHAHDRRVEPRPPLRPPLRSVAVWGPIAAVTLLALLVIFGAWRRISERHDQQNFAQVAKLYDHIPVTKETQEDTLLRVADSLAEYSAAARER